MAATSAKDDYGPRSPATFPSERKIVSILFADLVDSYALLDGMDLETTSEFLNRVLDYLCDIAQVHGGTVTSREGDGIMAVFGAPKAIESHEIRAVRAALDVHKKSGLDLAASGVHGGPQFYTTVHRGEVLVKSAPSLSNIPEVFGESVYLAARLNKVGGPGAVTVTREIAEKLANCGRLEQLGSHAIRGRADPVDVYRVLGLFPDQLQMHGAAHAGFSPFVGRDAEFRQLTDQFREVRDGRGGFCSIIGEAGSGKSRLLHEFRQTIVDDGIFLLRGSCGDFGGAAAYQPFREIVSPYLHEADEGGRATAVRRALGPDFGEDGDRRRALQAIAGRLPPASPWHGYDASRKTALIQGTILTLLRNLAEAGPVIVEIEDIHWIDQESARCLAVLLPSLSAERIFIIVSSRKPVEGFVDSACRIVLDALPSESVAAIVRHRLGDSGSTDAVIAAVSRLSGGNPLFVEECSRLVQEVGDGPEEPGGRGGADAMSLDLIKRSDIQSILAARIDDLPDPEARQLLTACSAIGPRFQWEILESISDVKQERLRALVQVLSDAELIFPDFNDGGSALRFKHAITRDVAYQGMTKAARAAIHAKILLAYERLYGDRATEFSDALREHAKRAGDLQRAIRYQRVSAMAALDRSAHSECLRMLRDCLGMAGSMPESQNALELQVDLLFELRNCLEIIEPGQIFDTLAQAEAICARIDDDRRKGVLAFHLAHAHWVAGRLEVALEHGRRAVEYGLRLDDPEIRIPGLYHSGLVLLGMGQHGEAASAFAEVIGAAESASLARRFRLNVSPSMLARSYRARCLAEMAEYDEALAEAEAARRQAKIEREHYAMGFAELAFGHAFIAMGDCRRAIPHLERSVDSFLASDAKVMCPVSEAFLGYAMALSGRGAEALPLLEAAVEASRASEVWEQLALRTMFLSEAHLSVGNLEMASETLGSARELAVRYDEQPSLAYIDYQAARIATVRDGALTEPGRDLLRTTIGRAERMQMLSLARKCGQLMEA